MVLSSFPPAGFFLVGEALPAVVTLVVEVAKFVALISVDRQ